MRCVLLGELPLLAILAILSLLLQAPGSLRPNVIYVIYVDKGGLSLVKVQRSPCRGMCCVNTGNLHLSMSHFLRADYQTLMGEKGKM